MRVALDQKLVFLSLQLKYKIKYLELDHDSLITMKLSLDRGVLGFVYMVSLDTAWQSPHTHPLWPTPHGSRLHSLHRQHMDPVRPKDATIQLP